MLLAIPTNREGLWKHIVNACRELKVEHEVFDIYAADWIERIRGIKPVGCLYLPEFRYAPWRELFGERIRFIHRQLNVPVYPRLHELELYESKRRMAYWLQANNVPHPRTWVFGNKDEALEFITSAPYPLIFKTDFGNASYGVRRLACRAEAESIWRRSFGNGYRVPYYREGQWDLVNRGKALVRSSFRRFKGIRHLPRDLELDVMLFQEEVPIAHEWRLIKAGDSYFGNEKVLGTKGFHSGSGHSAWTIPPRRVFDFAREVCVKGDFATMGLDVFETTDGRLLVNELQTVFGVVAKNQMYRSQDGRLVGFRLLYDVASRSWKEEEGEFGQDYCYRLRVKDFVQLLAQSNVHV